ncbi:hypothetical protein D3C76_622790 [compost metagenome]
MLITPSRPKVIARPSAASSRIDPSDRPLNAWPSSSPTSSLRLTWARLVSAAVRTPASLSTPGCSSASRRVRATGSPVSPSRRTAARRTAGSPAPNCRLARARPRAACTAGSASLAKRRSRKAICAGCALFCSCWAAARRASLLSLSNWWLARALSIRPRRRLFRRTLRVSPSAMRPWRRFASSARRAASGCAAQPSSRRACSAGLALRKNSPSLAWDARGSIRSKMSRSLSMRAILEISVDASRGKPAPTGSRLFSRPVGAGLSREWAAQQPQCTQLPFTA